MKLITIDNVSNHVDDIIDVADNIKPKKITILVGSNGIGKSMIRKILPTRMDEKGIKVASISMERRAGINGMEALNAFIRDCEWNPTSIESIGQIEGLLTQKDRYLVFDEPEVGMGDETILGLCIFLNKKLKKAIREKQIKGVLLITHSKLLVKFLEHDKFVCLDNTEMTSEEWCNREIFPLNIEDLHERSRLVHKEIQNRINNK